jgi:RHS repeat-associated protein
MALPAYTIQPGDALNMTQYEAGGRAGLEIQLDGTNNFLLATDQFGNVLGDDTVEGQWRHRHFILPSTLFGRTLVTGGLAVNSLTPAGHWDTYFRDITIVQANGTVIPLYKAGNPIVLSTVPTGGVTQISAVVESGTPLGGSTEDTVFLMGDHLGTAQLEVSSAGWPRWQGQFAPFGRELDTQSTNSNYKFTAKERDAESGLDYFGARYYGPSMGRFMSPDPMTISRSPGDPQTWNKYSYAFNKPLTMVDLCP